MRLRFVTSNHPISQAIRAVEYGFWASHVEAVLPDGSYFGAYFDGGVQVRPVGYDKALLQREEFVELDMALTVEGKFFDFLYAQRGKKYDLNAVIAFAIGRDWRENDSWFCSELQAAALEASGWLPQLAADVTKITPRDLRLILSGRADTKLGSV